MRASMSCLLRLSVLALFILNVAENGFCHTYPSGYEREKGLLFDFYPAQKLTLPKGAMKKTKYVKDNMECVFACMGVHWCRSINFKIAPRSSGLHACQLISSDQFTGKQYMAPSKAYNHYSVKNPCQEAPCSNEGNCTFKENRQHYKCDCKKGFEGENCKKDIDECSTGDNTCNANAQCTNTIGSYTCRCNPGSQGDGRTCSKQPYFQDSQGWTLIARFSNNDTKNWMRDDASWWYNLTTPQGDVNNTIVNQDMISAAFWFLKGNNIKITRSDDPHHTALLQTTSNCFSTQTFRSMISSYGYFTHGTEWASNRCRGSCHVSYGGKYQSTNGFSQSNCSSDIQNSSYIGFWCDWSGGDGAVMMIGGGGSGCGRADHGIAVTEEEEAAFMEGSNQGECDFGNEVMHSDCTTSYSLNLWIK